MIKKVKNRLYKHKRLILLSALVISLCFSLFLVYYIHNINIYGDFTLQIFEDNVNISDKATVKTESFFRTEQELEYKNYQWSNIDGYSKNIRIILNKASVSDSIQIVVYFKSGDIAKINDIVYDSNNNIIISSFGLNSEFKTKFSVFWKFSTLNILSFTSKALKFLLILLLLLVGLCLLAFVLLLLFCSLFSNLRVKIMKYCPCEFIRKNRKMEFSVRDVFLIFIIVMAILFVIESIAYFSLSNERRQSIFYSNDKNVKDVYGNLSFFDIDPLIGWTHGNNSLKRLGYSLKENLILLSTNVCAENDCINIFITGGSTSDIITDTSNWPKELLHILEKKQICANIYVGAVDGHNSGQELLRLIADGLNIKPDIHISYSGVNDVFWSGYTSQYEIENFYKLLFPERHSNFLPNLTFLLKSFESNTQLSLKERDNLKPGDFFLRNMNIMKSVADKYNYHFYGILLPVNKSDKVYSTYRKTFSYISEYEYLYSFLDVFDETDGDPFIDYCHIKPEYQEIIAKNIYKLVSVNISQ